MRVGCDAMQCNDRDEESHDRDEEKSRQDAGGTRGTTRE
jgi:hypothetical protein